MRVLHVISSGGMYGAEAVVLNLLRETAGEGGADEAMLAVFQNGAAGLEEDGLASDGLALHRHALAAGLRSFTLPCRGQVDLAAVRRIGALARELRADVVHAHGYKADVYTAVAAGRGEPWAFVSTCHNWCDTDLATRLYGAVDRFLLRRAAAVVAVSAEVRERLLAAGLRPERVTTIRNGVAEEPFRAALLARAGTSARVAEAPVVGFAGRLSREKGSDLFAAAAREILRERPEVRFLIAGDGPERAALEAELAGNNSVTLLGRVDAMPGFYASIDLLLSSSRTEGLPIGLLEAMASGLPVVATAVGDVPDVVAEGVTGLLCRAGDVPAMAAATLSLLGDPGRMLRMGAAGAARVAEQFSARRMARDYMALYAEVLRLAGERGATR